MIINLKKNYKKFAIIAIFLGILFLINIYFKLNNNRFESYYSQYLCSLLILKNGKSCIKEVLNNYDFFYFIKDFRKNVDLSINIKRAPLIENIMIIIGIIPFLKYNSVIRYYANTDEIYKKLGNLFFYKNIKSREINIDFFDFETVKIKFNNLINYIWETIPPKQILDNIRYIISNYYDDSCLYIFEKSLNHNYEYFIKNNEKIVSSDEFKKKYISK